MTKGDRRQPPWWPEGEAWPPAAGPPQGRFMRRMGWLLLLAVGLVSLVALAAVVASDHPFMSHRRPFGGALLGAAVLVVAVVAVLWGFRSISHFSRPVDHLIEAAGRIEGGDFSARVPEQGPPEMRSVARAFNQMSARLGAEDARRRGFLADVSHELRTPLAVIRGQAEAIVDGVYPAAAKQLAPILTATQTLDVLVSDLKSLALSDEGMLVLRSQPVDITDLLHEVAVAFRPQAMAAAVDIRRGHSRRPLAAGLRTLPPQHAKHAASSGRNPINPCSQPIRSRRPRRRRARRRRTWITAMWRKRQR